MKYFTTHSDFDHSVPCFFSNLGCLNSDVFFLLKYNLIPLFYNIMRHKPICLTAMLFFNINRRSLLQDIPGRHSSNHLDPLYVQSCAFENVCKECEF